MERDPEIESLLAQEIELSVWQQVVIEFKELRNASWTLWVVNLLILVSFYSNFVITGILQIYAGDVLGMSDLGSGILYASLGVSIGVFSLLFGFIPNKLGFKLSSLIYSTLILVGSTIQAFVSQITVAIISLLFLNALGISLAIPTLFYEAKLLTPPRAQKLSNSISVMMIYLSTILSGFALDLFNHNLSKDFFYTAVFLASAISALICLSISIALPVQNLRQQTVKLQAPPGLYCSMPFLKIVILIACITIIRSGTFGQLDTSISKYMTRTMGNDAYFGCIFAVHAVSMISAVVISTFLAKRINSYTNIIVGAIIGVIGTLIMFQDASYIAIIFFVIFSSVGEGILSPRLLDYITQVVPEGAEGVYFALYQIPTYFGMVLSGLISGLLFEEFCQEDDTERCEFMWLYIAIYSIPVPIILLAFRFFLEEKEKEDILV